MKNLHNKFAAGIVLLSGSLFASGSAFAQTDPHNLLDTVTVTGADFAIGLNTGTGSFDPLVPQDSSNDFADCVSTAAGGLTCIDGNDVVQWTSPIDPDTSSPTTLFDCGTDLPFNTKKGPGCTAIAQDAEGAIYLGGRLNGKGNILVKIVEDSSGICDTLPPSYTEFTGAGGDYCWATVQTGRPTLVDIDVIEGGLAAGFSSGEKQLLVLEERKTVLLYTNFDADPADTIVVDVASGKRGFGLVPKEEIVNAMLMEHVRPSVDVLPGGSRHGESDFFVYVATNKGRLIAVNPDGTPSGVDPLDISGLSSQPLCPAGEEIFDVAQGPNAGVVYATDRNSCVLYGFATTYDTTGDFDGFDVDIGKFAQISTSIVDESSMEVFLPPLTISAFPGFGFSLGGCAGGCTLIGSAGAVAASLANVDSVGDDDGVILFHVTGMPHCGWIPNTCVDLLDGPQAVIDGTREDAVEWLLDSANFPGTTPALLKLDPSSLDSAPAAELLVYNATPFLPSDVTDQYDDSGAPPNGLPPLLFPPEYRAQFQNGFFYDALFFVPEPGVQTDGVLTLDVDVELLTGIDFDCGTTSPVERDIVIRNSERWKSIAAAYNPGDNFQGSMSNQDCFNPTRSRSGGISMFPVNFELNPWPATEWEDGVWRSDICPGTSSCDFDDAVFAKLYVKLYDELRAHLNELACTTTDEPSLIEPLSAARCAALESNWLNGKSKLTRALENSIIPEPEGNCSGGSRNFGSVASQLQNYGNLLVDPDPALGPFGPDLANRGGEQSARVDTLVNILHNMLLPSIPSCPLGLVEEDTTWIQ